MQATHSYLPEKPHLAFSPFATWPSVGLPSGWFTDPDDPGIPEFYLSNGFMVLHEALTSQEVAGLNSEATRICRNADGSLTGIPSAGPAMTEAEILGDKLCIHFPHKISDTMRSALHHPSVVRVLTKVVGPDVKAMQSMLFVKAAGKPGQAWHQDEDFIPTRDRSLIGVWIALDDATIINGCLWVIPGSHRPGILWPMEWHGDRRFDCANESQRFPFSDADEVPVEVKAGSVVFFNGYTLHRSLPNRSPNGYRRALVNHYMSAQSRLPWGTRPENTSVGMWNHRDIVMVAGNDPYAEEGIADVMQALVRTDGASGCLDFVSREEKPYRDELSRESLTSNPIP